MALPNVMHTGRSAMVSAKAAIATTGHNISNANTEGYTRQRVEQEAIAPRSANGGKGFVGMGARIQTVKRLNDEYLDNQIRHSGKELAHLEEKDIVLKQTEDIFNEMGGEGLNRLMSKFFNEFRKLANEPSSEAARQSVRESSQALVADFRRLRSQVDSIRRQIDGRIESNISELNSLASDIKELNMRIRAAELGGASPNDLKDKREQAMKRLATLADINFQKDENGAYNIDIRNVGPLVTGPNIEILRAHRSPADEFGKPENALDIKTTSTNGNITQLIKGGKLGALVESRDKILSGVLSRLDELAFGLTNAVNAIHEQGYTPSNQQGISFFKSLDSKERAAEFLDLSEAIKRSPGNIATAAIQDAPGDNRIALAMSGLQEIKFLDDGRTSLDDFYNSIVSGVGVVSAKNRAGMNQQKDMITQLNKMRDQVSGVSIDEETANLLQFQHAFDASAKVIKIADECIQTVLDLKR